MISVNVRFRPSLKKNKEGVIYYHVIFNRSSRQIKTPYYIYEDEWDSKKETVDINANDSSRRDFLLLLNKRIMSDVKCIHSIASYVIRNNTFVTATMIVDEYERVVKQCTFFKYMESMIDKYRRNGQTRTAETYSSTLNSFTDFRGGHDLAIIEIDGNLLKEYELFLKSKGVSLNTVSFYMKRLRAVYNKAVDDRIVEQAYPFRQAYTSSEKTMKRAIPLESIRRLKSLDLSGRPSKCFARDMFMFSFYTRGMSFIDIAYLKKKDIKNGMLCYKRKKTGQRLYIKWEPCMQYIANKYKASEDSPYLLNIINMSDERRSYQNRQFVINRNLKLIGYEIGLYIPLTMYVARHSWASIAHENGVPVSVICDGMGHDSEKTTQIYLASLSGSVIDRVNSDMINSLDVM